MKAVILVIDSFGIGCLPDAAAYGDEGANTALHICQRIPGEKWPNLRKLGLGNASAILGNNLPGCEAVPFPTASFGVMAARSPGKDTTTGHWELAGIVLDKPFPTFPKEFPSFPPELIAGFEEKTGRKIIGNFAASGTAIIEDLGEEHLRTGKPIVYTSSDSVFQIAAHEEVITIPELYDMCGKARELCNKYQVGRVIARPFIGTPGSFSRTERRKDFSMPPSSDTILDRLQTAGVTTVGVGKIGDIFCERGIEISYHDKGNTACLARTKEILETDSSSDSLIFVNLVDTDMLYGHRRDAEGYCAAVQEIDNALPGILAGLGESDIFAITADHGCDPTYRGTDHTREYVPLLWYSQSDGIRNLGIREQFCDLAESLVYGFGAPAITTGVSFFSNFVNKKCLYSNKIE